MPFARDSQAIEGIPLKLLIVAIVLAITVPLIFSSLRSFDYARVEQDMRAEIDEFCTKVQLVYISGPGNSALIDFNVPTGSFAKVESLTFGDELGGAMASVVKYQIRGRAESVTVIEAPNVPMSSSNNTALVITSGHYEIKAECIVIDQDLNGDGFSQDTYIQLSLV